MGTDIICDIENIGSYSFILNSGKSSGISLPLDSLRNPLQNFNMESYVSSSLNANGVSLNTYCISSYNFIRFNNSLLSDALKCPFPFFFDFINSNNALNR